MAIAFFWDQSWLEKTPPKVFFLQFFLFKKIIFVNICIDLGFWGVKAGLSKIWEILGQNPLRNNLSKLTTFDPVFQLLHSGMLWSICSPNYILHTIIIILSYSMTVIINHDDTFQNNYYCFVTVGREEGDLNSTQFHQICQICPFIGTTGQFEQSYVQNRKLCMMRRNQLTHLWDWSFWSC